MNASELALLQDEIDSYHNLLSELYQILGQFQDEIPEVVLDKICAYINGHYNGKFADEYEPLIPWYRDEKSKQ